MDYITQIRNRGPVRATVVQELKNLGVKAPKCKKYSMKVDNKTNGKVFGVPINHLPSVIVDEDKHLKIPTFFDKLLCSLNKGIEYEGLFRKSGSVSRQRDIRKDVEKGRMEFDSISVYDLASLVKQFLRELPEPLIFTRLHDSFLKAQSFEIEEKRFKCIMMLCLLLPVEHINLLRYVMSFLNRLASFSDVNKMNVHNLSLIMAPNLLQFNDKTDKCSKTLQAQTGIVSTLITHADEIGLIPTEIMDKVISSDKSETSSKFEAQMAKSKRRNSINGVLHSIRKKTSQRSVLTESKDRRSQLSDNNNSIDTSLDDNKPKLVKRNSSKRKADKDESNSVPIKKRVLSQSCETSFITPTSQIGYINTSQSHLDEVQQSATTLFVGTPNTNCNTDVTTNVFTPTVSSKNGFKTPKSRLKCRFFSPAKLIRRHKSTVAPGNLNLSKNEKYKFADTTGFQLKPSDQQDTKKTPFFECSTVPLINFANPHVVPFRISSSLNSDLDETSKQNDLNTCKTSFREASKELDESFHLFEEKAEINIRDESQNEMKNGRNMMNGAYEKSSFVTKRRSLTDPNLCCRLEASERIISNRKLPVKSVSLRRGKPNTIYTGLPPTPLKLNRDGEMVKFKISDEDISKTIETKTSCNGIKPMVVIDYLSPKEHMKIEMKSPNFNEHLKNELKSPDLDESVTIMNIKPMVVEVNTKIKPDWENEIEKTITETEIEYDWQPKNMETKEIREISQITQIISPEEPTMEEFSFRSLTRASISQPDLKVTTRRSNSPCVPLTKKTQKMLTKVLEDEVENGGEDESLDEPTDEQVSWQPASVALNELTPSSSTMRPSLLLLKTERAGMVSENIRKYNAITKNFDHQKTPRSFRGQTRSPNLNTPIQKSKKPELKPSPGSGNRSIERGSVKSTSFSATPNLPRIAGLRSTASTPSLPSNRSPLKTRNDNRTPKLNNNVTPVFKTPLLPQKTPVLRSNTFKSNEKKKYPVVVNRRQRSTTLAGSQLLTK